MSRPEDSVSLSQWTRFLTANAGGGVIEGTVVSVVSFGSFIELGDGVHGLLVKSEQATGPELGSRVQVRIANVDLERRRVSLIAA